MESWKKFGQAVGSHMPFIVPLCVICGVGLPQVFGPVRTFVPVLFAFMTFQGALNNTLHQLKETFKHPMPLVAILAVSLVFMPLLAHALALLLFGGNPNLVTGIVLEYSVPIGVVSFMWVGMFSGNGSLALAAILISTVLAPFSIPLTLQVLLGATIHVDTLGMMVDMVFMIALPALAGMLLNDLTHGWGHRSLSPVISPACRVLLVLVITANSTAMSDYVLHMTWQRASVALFILLFAASGFIWGIVAARLLHQPFGNLVTMSFDCGLRNISSGAVIATQYFPGEVVFPVMCGTVFQQMLAALFGRVMQRLTESERAVQREIVARGVATVDAIERSADAEVGEESGGPAGARPEAGADAGDVAR